MSFLTRLSLANRGLVALIAIVVTGFGIYAIPSLKQQLLPSLEFPGAFIGAALPGASPEIIEAQITKPIEDAVKGADGLDSLESTTREGSASIQVTFEFGTDLDNAVNQLTTSVNRIQPTLPDNVEPTVFAGSTDDIPAIVLAASGGTDQTDLADTLDDTVVPELSAVEGVRDVQVTGTRNKQIVITPQPADLASRGIEPQAITGVLQANGVSVPAGSVVQGTRALNVQVGPPITDLQQIRDLYLTGSRGPVKLSEVASVEEKEAPATSYTRTDGADSLGIAVTAAPDGNPVQISHEVNAMLDDLQNASGAKLTVIVDQAPFVERSIESLTTEGLLGLLMAVIVILVFLLSVRSTLVTAVSIPLSVLIALIGLWIGDYSLNLLTLGALTIAVARVASLFVSLTVVPVLAYWFLRPAAGGAETEAVRRAAEAKELRSPLQRGYLPVIGFATRF